MSWRLRASRPADVPRLLEIWRGAVAATHEFLSPGDRARIDDMVAHHYLPGGSFLVAEDEAGRVAGWLGRTGSRIDALFVDPACHGRGIGRRLVEQVLSKENPATLAVNEDNVGARLFYERLGFVVTGRSERDDQGKPYPLLHMRYDPSGGTARHRAPRPEPRAGRGA